MSMQKIITDRIALAGERPRIPTALFSKPGDDYESRRDTAFAKAQAWDTAIKYVVADAIRTAADSELYGLCRLICPTAHAEDGSLDRKMLAAAVLSVEDCPLVGSASALARLFERE